ncbi:uncharacterized protein HMPREF1541_04190 [Cyphellophora europaea CBS 101466]|uniref:Nuclear pore assembly and biogenesis-domain-containing protein n=1 Tax=Cyphellophora europaea (strain CBS 101466) TaxID=1220924 RepID=W2S2Q6_CYPE1|nr:uncharacterized protein HMPREF1541_04190 [Cyphellophora europaea CBS 101466]ETN42249.1 hypothetical protein HMPREF1541_04190 [Cyphellophora europaea CBS 101466]
MSLTDAIDRTLSIISYLYSSTIAPLLPAPIAATIEGAAAFVSSLIFPIFRSGDLPSIAALLVILWLSLRTLDYIRRSVIGWIFLFVKLALLALLLQGVWYVNAYGFEKALHDAGWVGGILWGWAEGAWEGVDVGGNNGVYGGYGAAGAGRRGKGDGWNASRGRQQAGGGRTGNRWT